MVSEQTRSDPAHCPWVRTALYVSGVGVKTGRPCVHTAIPTYGWGMGRDGPEDMEKVMIKLGCDISGKYIEWTLLLSQNIIFTRIQ